VTVVARLAYQGSPASRFPTVPTKAWPFSIVETILTVVEHRAVAGVESMRKLFPAVGVVVVLLVGILVWPGQVLVGSSSSSADKSGGGALSSTAPAGAAARPGTAVPAAAAAVAKQLVAGSEQEQRAMLAPGLDQELPAGALFPAGSTIKLDARGWHQTGDYAAADGTLREPGAPAARVEIGFMQVSGQWRVTFEEKVS
jgi:hypothetical protein